jgi:2-keto-3-deoxy-L-rhamnonate aldolase RhmA
MYPGVRTFKQRVIAGAQVGGIFLQLGCAATAEIVAHAPGGTCGLGFDFAIVDNEHGMGGEEAVLAQVRRGLPAPACVRAAAPPPLRAAPPAPLRPPPSSS